MIISSITGAWLIFWQRHRYELHPSVMSYQSPEPHLNIKMSSYQYRDPHAKDKMVLSLTWESPYLWKTVWDGALFSSVVSFINYMNPRYFPLVATALKLQ